MNYIVEAKEITKTFIKKVALNNVSINIPENSVFGLLGPNGAGKTTFIRILNQIYIPDKGQILFKGKQLHPEDVIKFGYLPEERGLYKKMKVGEQIIYFGRLRGLSKKESYERAILWLEKLNIQDWWTKKIEELSKGMQQIIQFIVAIIHQPELIILDEPFSGLDPINTSIIKQKILELKENGSTIVLSTHDMNSVEELCDYVALINNSNLILQGKVEEIKQTYKENIYRLVGKGNYEKIKELPKDKVNIISINKKYDSLIDLQIKLKDNYSGNDLLREILQYFEIVHFSEQLPHMNEIFINLVKKSNI